MPTSVLAFALLAASPWFGLRAGEARSGCVEVDLVDPRGPAGSSGLSEGDCIVSVDGERVVGSEDLVRILKSREVGLIVRLELSNGRVLEARPAERTSEAERALCEYESSARTRLKVFIAYDTGGAEEIGLLLDGPVTLGEVRDRLHVTSPVRAVLNHNCSSQPYDISGSQPYEISDDPPDWLIVPHGSTLFFGYQNIRIFPLFRLPRQEPPASTSVPAQTDAGPDSHDIVFGSPPK